MKNLSVSRTIWRGTIAIFILLVFSTMSQANSEGLLGYWNFDSVENDIAPDLSENGLDGVLADVVVEENGGCGKAASLNGQTSNIVVEDFPGFDGELTLEAWFKMKTIWGIPPYLLKQGEDPEQGKIELLCPTQLHFSARGGTDPQEIYSTSEILIGNWYHVAVTLDDSQMKIYLNGNLENTVSITGNAYSDMGDLTLGYGTTAGWQALDGLLDEVRIHNQALSQEEIQADMDLCHPEGFDATVHSLAGVIRGNLQEGIKVDLSDDHIDTTYTDERGRFSFKDLPAGNYILTPQYVDGSFTPTTQQFTLDRLNLDQIIFEAAYTGNQSLGVKLWEFETSKPGIIIASPTVSEGKILLGNLDGNLYCLDTENGEKLWDYSVREPDNSSSLGVTETIIDRKRVYVTSLNSSTPFEKGPAKTCCLNAADGSLIWEKSMGGNESWPALYKGNLYVGTFGGIFHCLEAETGEGVWSYSYDNGKCYFSDWMEGGPAIYRNRIYFANWCGSVYCLDAETGEELWVTDLDIGSFSVIMQNTILSAPALSKDRLYIGGGIGEDWKGKIFCLDASSGEEVWSYQTNGIVFSSPAVDGDKIYFQSISLNLWQQENDGYIYCLDAETGMEIWKFPTGGNVWNYGERLRETCSPAIVNGKIYVGAWDNLMYCLDGETGKKIWSYDSGTALQYISAAISQGKVFFGRTGKIFCLNAGSEEVGEWPMFHKNVHRTGSTSVISGRIVNENGQPLPKAQLSASGGAGSDFNTTSNARGYYEFAELPEGTFTVKVSPQGYSMVTKKVTANPLAPIDDLDFILRPSICPATLALGVDSNDLITLRRFRDEVLSRTPEGQEIIRLYYAWGPVIVKEMEENEEFQEEIRDIIDGILPLIREKAE